MKNFRRKPEFDRFHKGLAAECEKIAKQLCDPYDHDSDTQWFTNIVRSKITRTWSYLVEKLNKEERKVEQLELRIKNLREALGVGREYEMMGKNINRTETVCHAALIADEAHKIKDALKNP